VINIDKYIILDLPESMIHSCIYLANALSKKVFILTEINQNSFQEDGIYFVSSNFSNQISNYFPEVNLVLNTLSFHEMGREEVKNYINQITLLFKKNNGQGFILEQNFDNFEEVKGCNAKKIIRQNFVSKKIETYTRQTRGYLEVHALDKKNLDLIDNYKPKIKLLSILSWKLLYLMTFLKMKLFK